MPFFATLALALVSFVVTALLAPKPQIQNAKPSNLGDFNFPRSEEGSPNTLFWGRLRLRGPNTLWYGNLSTIPITEKVKTGLFSSKRITVAHRYLLTIDLAWGLLTGADTRLKAIWFGERLAWSGNVGAGATDGVNVAVSAPALFGGEKEGGGVQGTVRFYNGAFTQTIDAHLASVVPDSTILPAYRGFIHSVFQSFEVGESPSVEPINVELENVPNFLGLGSVGDQGDANPAEIIFDILNNEWGRASLPSTALNATSFAVAGAALNTEGHGMSFKVEAANDARDVIQEVLDQIDGLIFEDPLTREINMRLIRNDYVVGDLPVFDQTNVREIRDYSVSTWTDTYNQCRVTWTDRRGNYADKTGVAQDMSNVNFQGRVRSLEFRYPGVTRPELANFIASRELALASIPLIKFRMTVSRAAGASLRPGDVILLNWPEYGVTNLVARVVRFDLGTIDDKRVAVDCVQDRFAISETVFTDPPATNWTPPDTAASPVQVRAVQELPIFLNRLLIANGGNTLGTDPDESYLHHIALAPTNFSSFFEAEVSEDLGLTYDQDNADTAFTASAQLNAGVGIDTAEFISGASTIVLKGVTDQAALATATTAELGQGANLILIGTELLAFETAIDNLNGTFTLSNVYRGLLDTSPRAHLENDRVWFLGFADLDNMGAANYAGTENLRVRQITRTALSSLNPADAAVDALQLQERPRRAYPPVGLTIANVAHPPLLSLENSPFTLAWRRRDRADTGVVLPGALDQDTTGAGVTYRLKYSVDGGMQTTEELGSGTSATTDFGGVAGEIAAELHAVLDGRESLFPVLRAFSLVGSAPVLDFRFWRVLCETRDNPDFYGIAELEMRETQGGSDETSTAFAVFGAERPGFEATKAFDGIVSGNNSWSAQDLGTNSADLWVGQDFGVSNEKGIREIVMTARADGFFNQCPTGFSFQGSSDGSAWQTVASFSGLSAWSAAESRTFQIQ